MRWRFDSIVAHLRINIFGIPLIKGDQAFLSVFADGRETRFKSKLIYRGANKKSFKVIGVFMDGCYRGGCDQQRGCDGLQRLHRVD